MHYFHPIVQERMRQCLMYFGSGLGFTGVMVGALRNSTIAYTANPWITWVPNRDLDGRLPIFSNVKTCPLVWIHEYDGPLYGSFDKHGQYANHI